MTLDALAPVSCGPRAWLLRGDGEDFETLSALVRALDATPPPGLAEWVLGQRDLLLLFKDNPDRSELETRLANLAAAIGSDVEARRHEIPVRYDGPDLAEVAAATGLSVEEVVTRHSEPTYTVRFLGFAPGFAYLDGLDPALHLPRRGTPRPRMNPGAIAIGGGHAGIYPIASPGGWHWLGHTDVELFCPHDPADPFLLRPGDQVTFVTD